MKRSGRTSIPVLDSSLPAPGLADRENPLLTIKQKSRALGGKGFHPRTRSCKDASRGKSMACAQHRGALTARRGENEGQRDVSSGGNAAATPHEQQVAVGDSTTRPVLNWWRSQRLTGSDGGVVPAAGISQNRPSPGRPTERNRPESGSCSPALHTTSRKRDVQEESWTKAQLYSLRRSQADTALSVSDFWGAVASNVQDRDPQDCQQKWFEHFATPRGRRRKASKQGSPSRSAGTALLSDNTSRSSREVAANAHESPERINQPPERGNGDDLFEATPMRGRRQVGTQPTGGELEAKTPRTPAGPGVPIDYTSAVEAIPRDGADYNQRGISKTYIMSKKMRRRASQLGKNSVVTRERAKKTPYGSAGRSFHAAAISQGHQLKVSVTSLGDVSLASTCNDEDSVCLSGSCETSDDE